MSLSGLRFPKSESLFPIPQNFACFLNIPLDLSLQRRHRPEIPDTPKPFHDHHLYMERGAAYRMINDMHFAGGRVPKD